MRKLLVPNWLLTFIILSTLVGCGGSGNPGVTKTPKIPKIPETIPQQATGGSIKIIGSSIDLSQYFYYFGTIVKFYNDYDVTPIITAAREFRIANENKKNTLPGTIIPQASGLYDNVPVELRLEYDNTTYSGYNVKIIGKGYYTASIDLDYPNDLDHQIGALSPVRVLFYMNTNSPQWELTICHENYENRSLPFLLYHMKYSEENGGVHTVCYSFYPNNWTHAPYELRAADITRIGDEERVHFIYLDFANDSGSYDFKGVYNNLEGNQNTICQLYHGNTADIEPTTADINNPAALNLDQNPILLPQVTDQTLPAGFPSLDSLNFSTPGFDYITVHDNRTAIINTFSEIIRL